MPKKSGRKRSKQGYSQRIVGVRDPLERFLIVCEGKRTEPNYFRVFRVPGRVTGLGEGALDLVKRAIVLAQEDDYDQVWCVFDRDNIPVNDFNAAIDLARGNGLHVAYSNEAFELWYLLHFHYYNTAVSRQDYIAKLGALMGHAYVKNSLIMFIELASRQPEAIRNAHRLLTQYDPPNPAQDNPSTTVHLLVEQLNRFAR